MWWNDICFPFFQLINVWCDNFWYRIVCLIIYQYRVLVFRTWGNTMYSLFTDMSRDHLLKSFLFIVFFSSLLLSRFKFNFTMSIKNVINQCFDTTFGIGIGWFLQFYSSIIISECVNAMNTGKKEQFQRICFDLDQIKNVFECQMNLKYNVARLGWSYWFSAMTIYPMVGEW